MMEVAVHRGPGGRIGLGCRIRPGCPGGGAVVTVAMWRWDGYHRRVVTSGRLAAGEPGRFPELTAAGARPGPSCLLVPGPLSGRGVAFAADCCLPALDADLPERRDHFVGRGLG